MTYYDEDLGIVMCESELSPEIDALDWEDAPVACNYVELHDAHVLAQPDDEIPF